MDQRASALIALITLVVTLFMSWHLARKKQWHKVYKEQLLTVYHPIFVLLEDYFYRYEELEKDITFGKALWDADQIIKCNRLLVTPSLYLLFEKFKMEQTPFKKAIIFNKISSNIIKDYSEKRYDVFACGLSTNYIAEKKLYKNKWRLLWRHIKTWGAFCVTLILCGYFSLFIYFALLFIFS